MAILMRRLSLLALAGFLLTAGVWQGTNRGNVLAQGTEAPGPATAQPPQGTTLPTTKPIIHGSLNGTVVDGILGTYCWPPTDPTADVCDIVQNPQPTNPINVSNGDSIVFTSDLPSPTPVALQATLLDDKNADGENIVVSLTNTGGIFSVSGLQPGNHRLVVEADYPNDALGDKMYVDYVFLLVVGQSGAATAPAGASTQPVALSTTEVGTQQAAQTGVPATLEATSPVIAPTVVSPGTQSPQVTAIVLPTGVAPATQAAQPTATPAPLIQPTVQPTGTPIPATPVPPAITELPTETPSNPNPTTPGTVTPALPVQGSGPGQGNIELIPGISVPPATLIVEGRTFDAIAVNSCIEGAQGETICINRPTNTTSITAFGVAQDVAQINFKGPRPSAITVSLFSSDGTTLVNKQSLQPDNLVLYTLPSAAGNFVLDVDVVFPGGKATYYFRLNLS